MLHRVRKYSRYGIYTYKNPNLGGRGGAAHVAPFFSILSFLLAHAQVRVLSPALVRTYWHMSPAVDTCNQLAL